MPGYCCVVEYLHKAGGVCSLFCYMERWHTIWCENIFFGSWLSQLEPFVSTFLIYDGIKKNLHKTHHGCHTPVCSRYKIQPFTTHIKHVFEGHQTCFLPFALKCVINESCSLQQRQAFLIILISLQDVLGSATKMLRFRDYLLFSTNWNEKAFSYFGA